MANENEGGSPRHWLLVAALLIVYIYAFVDRVILALVVDPIRRDLGASDVQMGLLLGFGFALFFAICGVPAGVLVDRLNRRWMIGAASIFWALMTIACGTAQSVATLFAVRAGVGVAEALVLPAAFSLIQDAVPPRTRGLAFSIFAMSPLIGSTVSLLAGGKLLGFAAVGGFDGWPILSGLAPWRATLIATGLAGLPLSLFMMLAPEPARISTAPHVRGGLFAGILPGMAAALRFMRQNRRVYVPLLVFGAVGSMSNFAASSWTPALVGRAWGLAPQQVGPWLGMILMTCGVGGLAISGVVLNRLATRADIHNYGLIAATGTLIGFVGMGLAPSLPGMLVMDGIGSFFMGTSFSVAAATLSEVTPRPVMGRVTALYFMFQSLFGHAMGPLLVGLGSEHLFEGRFALAHSFALCCGLFGIATIWSVSLLKRRVAARPGQAAFEAVPIPDPI